MIRRDPLFKGATRPAMFLGVPLVPLAVVCGVGILIAVWTSMLVSLALIPIIAVMRAMTKSDDQQFRLLGLKLWCRVLPHYSANSKFWGASAYSPVVLKKRR